MTPEERRYENALKQNLYPSRKQFDLVRYRQADGLYPEMKMPMFDIEDLYKSLQEYRSKYMEHETSVEHFFHFLVEQSKPTK